MLMTLQACCQADVPELCYTLQIHLCEPEGDILLFLTGSLQ